MRTGPLREQFVGAKSVLQLATRLGRATLSNARALTKLDADERIRPFCRQLEEVVRAIDQDLWLYPDPEGDLSFLLRADQSEEARELARVIDFLEAHSPIEYLAVLRGLLPVLRRFYDEATGEVAVESGTPLPVATRRVNDLFPATPRIETLRLNDLLLVSDAEGNPQRSGLYLPDFGLDDRIPIVLDFSHKQRLDELAWRGPGLLPRIATVHPPLGRRGITIGRRTESTFFDVRPRQWDCDQVARQLNAIAAEVEIAVLPELSLPQVDALEEALAAEPGAFPPLIVAGSAHVSEEDRDEDPVRANESRIYLDGRRVAAQRKIHAFLMRVFEGERLPRPLREGITPEEKPLTILAGDRTRLAVAICADVIDSRIPHLLEEAGVNLLLVPALTVDPGSFNSDACRIAAQAQGVTVVVNGDGTALVEDGEVPFLVMVGVPRPRQGEQSREYERPLDTDPPYTGVFDPNLPLHADDPEKEAFAWR